MTRSFAIAPTPTTQAEYLALMGDNPSAYPGCGDTCPVDSVNWSMAADYCTQLGASFGLPACYICTGTQKATSCSVASPYDAAVEGIYDCPGFRLPTEAEWELAARAGTTSPSYAGEILNCKKVDSVAEVIGWYKQNAGMSTQPVTGKLANPWGLYDMLGNTWEWTQDYYEPSLGTALQIDPAGPITSNLRTARGGSYFENAENLRAAARIGHAPGGAWDTHSFRCARTLPSPP